MAEWKEYELNQICSRLSSGKGLPAKKISDSGKYPVYGGNGLRGYTETANFEGDCAIIGRQGAYCGNVRYFSGTAYMTEHAVVTCANENNNTRYLSYLLSTMNLGRLSGQSAQPGLSVKTLGKQVVKVPPLTIQNKIVSILAALDTKIEDNEKINKNLEQQISVLYQSWFEDFDLTEGVCPESWSNQELSTIAEISSGKRPPIKAESYSQETPIPIVGAASVMGFTSEANHKDKILVTGRVGTHGIVQRFSTPCWTSDNTLVIKSDYYEFTNQILRRIDYSSMNRGSTQPLITQGDMKKVEVLVPDDIVLAKFEAFAGTLMAQWEANNQENINLANLRDTLLPKLMSGELDVSGLDI